MILCHGLGVVYHLVVPPGKMQNFMLNLMQPLINYTVIYLPQKNYFGDYCNLLTGASIKSGLISSGHILPGNCVGSHVGGWILY